MGDFVGIDISKQTFDVYFEQSGRGSHSREGGNPVFSMVSWIPDQVGYDRVNGGAREGALGYKIIYVGQQWSKLEIAFRSSYQEPDSPGTFKS